MMVIFIIIEREGGSYRERGDKERKTRKVRQTENKTSTKTDREKERGLDILDKLTNVVRNIQTSLT